LDREASFTAVHRRYADRLHGHCRRRGLSGPDADDAVQEVFLRFLAVGHEQRRRIGDPGRWLFGTTKHVVNDVFRRKKRRREHAPPGPELAAPPIWGLESEEASDLIHAELDALPDKLRIPLALKMCRHSYREIGKQLKISGNAAAIRVFRAREILKKRIDERNAPE